MTPNEIQITANLVTSIHEYMANPESWEQYADSHLIREVSYLLVKERTEKIITDDMVEKRINLYVAPPDVFWEIVNCEAQKIATRYMSYSQGNKEVLP